MLYVGVDPGMSGALAVISTTSDDQQTILIIDMPVMYTETIGGKKRGQINRKELLASMRSLMWTLGPITMLVLEEVHSFPRQGAASMFTFGRQYGTLEMMCDALEIPYQAVAPQRWKKVMMAGTGTTKEASIARALTLYPTAADVIGVRNGRGKVTYKDGRAEALLMAGYAARVFGTDTTSPITTISHGRTGDRVNRAAAVELFGEDALL